MARYFNGSNTTLEYAGTNYVNQINGLISQYRGSVWVNLHEYPDNAVIFQFCESLSVNNTEFVIDNGGGFVLYFNKISPIVTDNVFTFKVASKDSANTLSFATNFSDENAATAANYFGENRTDAWHHLAFDVNIYINLGVLYTIDARLWVDGELEGTASITTAEVGSFKQTLSSLANIYLGGDQDNNYVLDGQIADPFLASGLWSAGEITSLYTSGEGIKAKDVVSTSTTIYFNPDLNESIIDTYGNITPTENGLTFEYLDPHITSEDEWPGLIVLASTASLSASSYSTIYSNFGTKLGKITNNHNICSVIHVGNLTSDATDSAAFSRSNTFIENFNTEAPSVPLNICTGRRDHVGGGNNTGRNLSTYDTALSAPYTDQTWPYVVMAEDDVLDDVYTYFTTCTIANQLVMIVNIPYAPTPNQIKWVIEQCALRPNYAVIININAFINTDGKLLTTGDSNAPSSFDWQWPTGWQASGPYDDSEPLQNKLTYPPRMKLYNPDFWWFNNLSRLRNVVAIFSGEQIAGDAYFAVHNSIIYDTQGRAIHCFSINNDSGYLGGDGFGYLVTFNPNNFFEMKVSTYSFLSGKKYDNNEISNGYYTLEHEWNKTVTLASVETNIQFDNSDSQTPIFSRSRTEIENTVNSDNASYMLRSNVGLGNMNPKEGGITQIVSPTSFSTSVMNRSGQIIDRDRGSTSLPIHNDLASPGNGSRSSIFFKRGKQTSNITE